MSRVQVKTIRLEHRHGALFDYSVKGKKVDHIRFSQAERSVVYVTVVFADRTEWSISIEPFSLPTARVSHFISIEEDPIAESGQMFLPDHPASHPQYEEIQQPTKQRNPRKRSRK
ncbi:MAG TPA: hypothetical protein VGI45_34780 [Terracidiphilus sp.]|jgi:hypothetical protein